MAYVHGDTYRERVLLAQAGNEIRNREGILALLEAISLSKGVSTIHGKIQLGGKGSLEARGHRMDDFTAQEVALEPVEPLQVLVSLLEPSLLDHPEYRPDETDWEKWELATQNKQG